MADDRTGQAIDSMRRTIYEAGDGSEFVIVVRGGAAEVRAVRRVLLEAFEAFDAARKPPKPPCQGCP